MGFAVAAVNAWKDGTVRPKAFHIREMVAILGKHYRFGIRETDTLATWKTSFPSATLPRGKQSRCSLCSADSMKPPNALVETTRF
jgi:hypothetical protein